MKKVKNILFKLALLDVITLVVALNAQKIIIPYLGALVGLRFAMLISAILTIACYAIFTASIAVVVILIVRSILNTNNKN
jgi:hypothetical protein